MAIFDPHLRDMADVILTGRAELTVIIELGIKLPMEILCVHGQESILSQQPFQTNASRNAHSISDSISLHPWQANESVRNLIEIHTNVFKFSF